ncbi:hypothetical protein WR25_25067 [Diploscapter pachys]|uniref:Uncharacterized protein n=1 Tax=Diploscapter pachys TaxID=2018661 RepID=A0A2A2M3I3_9BILA|nr:hypothetical protein WR25_25067 [Diploscapter pachys]
MTVLERLQAVADLHDRFASFRVYKVSVKARAPREQGPNSQATAQALERFPSATYRKGCPSMTLRPFLALGISAALLAGCATTAGPLPPTDVIRYHLGEPIPRDRIA